MRVKHCTHGHSITTLLNPRSEKYNLTVANHSSVVVALPSTIYYLANYKINILFQIKFTNVNKLFILITYYRLRKVPSYETKSYYNSLFCKRKHLHRG
jgi:hypothetical protein